MSIGHGTLGFLSNLRGITELIDEDGADLRPYFHLQLGKSMSGAWIHHQSATYRQVAHFVFSDGVLRDVVAVVYGGLIGLTRAEDLATCVATAGTYYFSGEDALLFPGSPGWDGSEPAWDAGSPFWDLYPPAELYVHLYGDQDPNSFEVVALLGFFLGGTNEVHPTLGPNLLLNGELEDWLTTTDAEDWTEVTPVGTSVTRETGIAPSGLYSAKLTTDGSATAGMLQLPTPTLKVGRRYRMSGYYLTPNSNPDDFIAQIFLGLAGDYLLADGRTYATAGTPPIFTSSRGERKRFLFDFIAPSTGAVAGVLASEAGGTGSIYLDSLELRRIYRFNHYNARLALDSIPEVVTSCGRFFGGQTIGLSGISLLNGGTLGEGYWEAIFGQLLVHRKPAHLFLGGVFKDGTELYRDAWQPRFAGLVEEHEVQDDRATLQLQDWRSFLKNTLPSHRYDDRANVEARSIGQGRPMLFGEWFDTNSYLRAVRVGISPLTGYGIYEVADPTLASVEGNPAVYSWLDDETASRLDLASSKLLTGADYTYSGATARITLLRDIRLIRIDVKHYIDFVHNGSTWVASVGPGINTIHGWCALLQTAMRSVSGSGTLTVTYSDTVHKVAIADTGASELRLHAKTGANVTMGFWDALGFDQGTDKAFLLVYEAENTLFAHPDRDHILRVNATGYLDDAAGTFTGTPSQKIEKPEPVARFIIARALGVGDTPFSSSFLNIGVHSTSLQVLIDEDIGSDEVLARIENSALATIVMDGGGIFHWVPYSDSTSKRTFYDRDYLSWSMGRRRQDVAYVVRLFTPRRDKRDWSIERRIPSAPARHWTFTPVDIWTYLTGTPTGGNIATIADKYVQLYTADPREVNFAAKGKLTDLKVSDIITLNRARGEDPTGTIVNVKFRIIGLNFNDALGIANCKALEYIELI